MELPDYIWVVTDYLASLRGLDIPTVGIVINYDVPGAAKDYIHRVLRILVPLWSTCFHIIYLR